MAGKGDRNRTADLVSYENNWDTIFGKKDTNTPEVADPKWELDK